MLPGAPGWGSGQAVWLGVLGQGGGVTGGPNGIFVIGSSSKWFEPRCLGQPFCLTAVGLY